MGYKGSQLHFVTDDVLVYGCSNTLSFIRTNGVHVKSITSEGSGVSALAVCHTTGCVAYAEATLNPKIFIINYPFCDVQCTLRGMKGSNPLLLTIQVTIAKCTGGAALEFKHLGFSNSGKRLVSLSGVPDLKMTLW